MITRNRLVLIGLAYVITAIQLRAILAFANPTLEQMHGAIVNFTAPSPYRFRTLVPILVEQARLAGIMLVIGYAGFYFVANSLSLYAIDLWFRAHVSPKAALSGSILATVSMIWSYSDGTVHPWTNLEVATVAWVMWSAWTGRSAILTVLVMLLAVLNRETGLALPIVYIILAGKRQWYVAAAGLGAGGVLYGLLQWSIGSTARIITVEEIVSYNISPIGLMFAVTGLVGFLGGFWLNVFKWPKDTLGLKLAGILILYLVPLAVFGIWREVRLLVPLIPALFIPVVKQFDEPA